MTCSTDATRTVFHLSSESIHIFQLIDFGITLQLRYSVDETAHTKSLFISSSLLLVFVLFSLAVCTLRKCETKSNKKGREMKQRASEMEAEQQLLCAEKQTSFLSTSVTLVTLNSSLVQCQGRKPTRELFIARRDGTVA